GLNGQSRDVGPDFLAGASGSMGDGELKKRKSCRGSSLGMRRTRDEKTAGTIAYLRSGLARRVVAGIERSQGAADEEGHAMVGVGADPAEMVRIVLANELVESFGAFFISTKVVNDYAIG